MIYDQPKITFLHDTAFVEVADEISLRSTTLVQQLAARLLHPAISEIVPAYASLLLHYDASVISHNELRFMLHIRPDPGSAQANRQPTNSTRRLVELPVQYGGECGPDLSKVAAHCGLTEAEVVARHATAEYVVAMLGFAPGFAYLLGLPSELATPRLSTPRLHVAPGSVGIAGGQTGIYALDTPGGWQIIGRTPTALWDAAQQPPSHLQPGDRVLFVPLP